MVHEMHPEVAAALKDAQSLIQIMDDQLQDAQHDLHGH